MSLKRKIILLFIGIGFLPLFFLIFLAFNQTPKYLEKTTGENLLSLAKGLEGSLRELLQSVFIQYELLVNNSLIKSREVGPQAKLEKMREIQNFSKIFEDITLIDLEGQTVASTNYLFRGDWQDKIWYQRAKGGEISISPVHQITHPIRWVIVFTMPIRDEKGEIFGVIAAQMNMEKFWEILDRVRIRATGFAFLVDEEGKIVAHRYKKFISLKLGPEVLKKMAEKEGVVTYTEGGEKIISSFVDLEFPFGEKKWKIIVSQKRDEALFLVNLFQDQIIGISLATLALIFFGGYFLSHQIVSPIKKLEEATKKMALGELETEIEIKTGDEIEELVNSFNKMAKELQKLHSALKDSNIVLEIRVKARTKQLEELAQSLEQQVKERTKELEEKIEELEKFTKLAVGRELRMIELKKEIQELKEKIKEKNFASA